MAAVDGAEIAAVLNKLSEHACQLEEEVRELGKDSQVVEEMHRKYGETFVVPLGHLTELRERKKGTLRAIIARLEGLQRDLSASVSLARELEAPAPPVESCRLRTVSPTRLPTAASQHSTSPRNALARTLSPKQTSELWRLPRPSWVPPGRTSPMRRF
eukprot:Hpha_TRINITY_DN16182_c1_g9::TRINITY_DN16182_c1_g9_i1::g.8097::m.8097